MERPKIITDIVYTDVVSLANMRNYLEFTATDATEDALITSMLKSAIKLCQEYTNEAFGLQTIEVFLQVTDLDNDQRIDLPMSPFGVMTSVIPIDVEGTEGDALVLNTGYYLNGNQVKSIKLITQNFLVGMNSYESYYKIRYTCGYGISGVTETIPEGYKQAVMEQVRLWYKRKDYVPVLDYQIKRILDLQAGLSAI